MNLRIIGCWCRDRLQGLHRDEEGAAYALSFVMAFPFYVAIILLITEMSSFVVARIGVEYAAFAGARAAVVWRSQLEQDAGQKKGGKPSQKKGGAASGLDPIIKKAVSMAMAPYASGEKAHAKLAGRASAGDSRFTSSYFAALKKLFPRTRLKSAYVDRKLKFALGATKVTWKLEDPPSKKEPWDRDLSVTVTYTRPFHIPFIGFMFRAKKKSGIYVVDMVAKSTLTDEGVRNKSGSLGIRF